MRIIAILDVDEKKLIETGHSFEYELGWVNESGIRLKEYKEVDDCSEFEYAAFVWNVEKHKYEQIGRSMATKLLCENRYQEAVGKGLIQPQYDTKNVLYRKRRVSTIYEHWEDLSN